MERTKSGGTTVPFPCHFTPQQFHAVLGFPLRAQLSSALQSSNWGRRAGCLLHSASSQLGQESKPDLGGLWPSSKESWQDFLAEFGLWQCQQAGVSACCLNRFFEENMFRNWQDISQDHLAVNPWGRTGVKKDSFGHASCPGEVLKWEQWWEAWTVVGVCGAGCFTLQTSSIPLLGKEGLVTWLQKWVKGRASWPSPPLIWRDRSK